MPNRTRPALIVTPSMCGKMHSSNERMRYDSKMAALRILSKSFDKIVISVENDNVHIAMIDGNDVDLYASLVNELASVLGKDAVTFTHIKPYSIRSPTSIEKAMELRQTEYHKYETHLDNIASAKKDGFDIRIYKFPSLRNLPDNHFTKQTIQHVVGCTIIVHAEEWSDAHKHLYIAGVFDAITPFTLHSCEACGKHGISLERFCRECTTTIDRIKSLSVHTSKCVRGHVLSNDLSVNACLITTCWDHNPSPYVTRKVLNDKTYFCTTFQGPSTLGGPLMCHDITCTRHHSDDRTIIPGVCNAIYAWEDLRENDGNVVLEYPSDFMSYAKRVSKCTSPSILGYVECPRSELYGSDSIESNSDVSVKSSNICRNMACGVFSHSLGDRRITQSCRPACVSQRFAEIRSDKVCHDILCQKHHYKSDSSTNECDLVYIW